MAAPSHAHLQRLGSILATLPRVQYAFAYGSGVHHQPGLYDAPPQSQQSTAAGGSGGAAAAGGGGAPASSGGGKQPMIDYILAVEDPESWHAQVRDMGAGAGTMGRASAGAPARAKAGPRGPSQMNPGWQAWLVDGQLNVRGRARPSPQSGAAGVHGRCPRHAAPLMDRLNTATV